MPVTGSGLGNAKGTLAGVPQIANFNPYQVTSFTTMAWQAGVNIYGSGSTIAAYNRGDWSGISRVDFGSGARSITIEAGTVRGSVIRVSVDSPTGPVLGYVTIPATGDNFKYTKVKASISGASGVKNVFFVASGDVVLNTFVFSK
jgi:arabinoxylan arabinofuranohydrolase